MNTRALSLLMAMLLSASAMAACGNAETADTTADTETTTAATETAASDPFAGMDFGGKELRISSSIDEMDATNGHRLIAGSGELNGEIVNDAVFNRNQKVEEMLNIHLDFQPAEWDYNNLHIELEKLILAGDCGFEVVINDMGGLNRITSHGCFHSVADNDIMDFSASYWYGEAMEDLMLVDGAKYLMLGDLFTDSLASAHVMYYNKDVIRDNYGSDNYVQDIVMEGGWIVDELVRISEEVSVDLDGDGTLTETDRMGLAYLGPYGPMVPVVEGFGIQWIQRNGGEIRYAFNNERSVKALEKMNELYWKDTTLKQLKDHTTAGLRSVFVNQNAVFVGYLRLCDLEQMRDVEFGIGLAPYPKLDEGQKDYCSSLHDTSEVGAIVVTTPVSELEFVSSCLEVMAREAAETVIPAYYEESLKIKYVGGSGDAAMIDLIHNSINSPFGVAYNNVLNGSLYSNCFLTPLVAKSTDFASGYAKQEGAAEEILQEMVVTFEKTVANAQ